MPGRVYTCLIIDGSDWDMGDGAYNREPVSLARIPIMTGYISGVLIVENNNFRERT